MKQGRILNREVERVIYRWCEARNIGQLSRVGPDRLSKTETMHEGYADQWGWECQIITDALFSYGGGIYYPRLLVHVLDLVYWHGKAPSEFCIFDPGRGLSKEILQLGIRSGDLVRMAIAKFGRIVEDQIQKTPKPVPISQVLTEVVE